jgi:hypothetical protein
MDKDIELYDHTTNMDKNMNIPSVTINCVQLLTGKVR